MSTKKSKEADPAFQHQEDLLDQALRESMPASDPVAVFKVKKEENMEKVKTPEHATFKEGQGWGSAEPGSEFQTQHKSMRQYGDNPLPPSGGNWERKGKKKQKGNTAHPKAKKSA